MSTSLDNETRILRTWEDNAKPWIESVQEQGIRSEGVVSRDALIAAIERYARSGSCVLDVGCGEGWLGDELSSRGFSVTGVDASEPLIEFARQHRRGIFHVGDQADLIRLGLGTFDLVVCNFSLFGDEPVRRFIASVPELLSPGGVLIIQTLHPFSFHGNDQSESGWRDGTWAGLPGNFGEPSPVYIRTLDDWSLLFRAAGLRIDRTIEPASGEDPPQSLIFVVSDSANNGGLP